MRKTHTILVSAVLGLSAASGLAEPTSGVLSIQRLATIEDMGRMAVNPATGEIAFGRTGPGVAEAQFIRVLAPNGTISQAGDIAIRDPDAVAWDMDGSFGPAGSILVGSNRGLFAITPGNHVNQFAWRGEDLINPEDLSMGADGALYYADYGLGKVMRLSVHGSFSEMMHKPSVTRLDVGPAGQIVAVDLAGSLSSEAAAPVGRFGEIAFGDGSANWGEDRYTIDLDFGNLLRIDESGHASVLATGFLDGLDAVQGSLDAQIGFLPTGEMVVGVAHTGAVYTLVPAPSSVVLAGLGAVLAARRQRADRKA